ncbi:PIH1 N-terminal domain/PIH1 CS-like domain containing protein [Lotmaria passim]
MPLERVSLARGTNGAAASAPSSDKFTATPEELRVIQEKMKDPVFVELMHDYMKSLGDPETRREEEAYLEQAEREAREGGDFSFEFVFPRPAYVVELLEPSNTRLTSTELKQLGLTKATEHATPIRSFLNVCQSDKVKTFTEHSTGDRYGSNWEVPVSVSQRRVEAYNPVSASPSQKVPAEFAASAAGTQPCIVHDAVFHPATLALAERSNKFLCFLTEIAVEHLNSGYGESNGFKFRRLPSSVLSIGTPQNQTLRTTQGKSPFEVDPRDPVLQRPTRHISGATKSPTSTLTENNTTATPATTPAAPPPPAASPPSSLSSTLPPYTIAHRGSVDLTEAWRWSVSDKRVGVPAELVVKLTFAEVQRAAALDITITADGHAVRVNRTAGQSRYAGEVPLPFAVEEEPTRARFDRARGVLTLILKVVPPPLPAGALTAAELRRTLPGAPVVAAGTLVASSAEAGNEKMVEHEKEEVGERDSTSAAPPATAPTVQVPLSPPSSPRPSASDKTAQAAQVKLPASVLVPTSTQPTGRPELAHIGDQDRVAAMMAQVQAARAARVAAAAAEKTDRVAKDETASSSAAPAQAAVLDTPPAPAREESKYIDEAPPAVNKSEEAAPTVARTSTNAAEVHKSEEPRIEKEAIPLIRKTSSQTLAAGEAMHHVRASDDNDVDSVRARQQAWATMMEAEMQAAKAREEAEAAEAARAAEVQAAKARRKLAAEKEQERVEQLAQAKRDAMPLSNKYIFAID